MKNISGTKVLLMICGACFALIAAGVMHALGVPGKIVEAVKSHKK